MSEFQRGKVTKVTFEIEYPDGSTKVSELADPGGAAKVVFVEGEVAGEDVETYNVSDADWKQNPAMIVYPQGGGGGIPFCTHNGCST